MMNYLIMGLIVGVAYNLIQFGLLKQLKKTTLMSFLNGSSNVDIKLILLGFIISIILWPVALILIFLSPLQAYIMNKIYN